MTEFSKGPWDCEFSKSGNRIRIGLGMFDGPDGYDVAKIDLEEVTNETFSEAQANAYLIAAAPDLYEALDSLVRITDDGFNLTSISVAIQIARAALAKARGEA